MRTMFVDERCHQSRILMRLNSGGVVNKRVHRSGCDLTQSLDTTTSITLVGFTTISLSKEIVWFYVYPQRIVIAVVISNGGSEWRIKEN